jgi:hypothetical protein
LKTLEGTREDDKTLLVIPRVKKVTEAKVDEVLEDLSQHCGTIYQTA